MRETRRAHSGHPGTRLADGGKRAAGTGGDRTRAVTPVREFAPTVCMNLTKKGESCSAPLKRGFNSCVHHPDDDSS